MINKYLEYIGFAKNDFPYRRENYVAPNNQKMADLYLKYLEDLKQTQDSRQHTIESKNSQILGQSSIVISIVSLFIPVLVSQIKGINIFAVMSLMLLFLALLSHFILSIYHALKTLQIDKTRYMEGSTATITKENRAESIGAFVEEQIKDLILMINYNNSVTNQSASNLVYASRNFNIGILTFFIFIITLMGSFFFTKESVQEISITNLKELQTPKPGNMTSIFQIKPYIMDSVKTPISTNKVIKIESLKRK